MKSERFNQVFLRQQSELADALAKDLLSRTFENRFTLHPRRLQEIAPEEVVAFTGFLSTHDLDAVQAHGEHRAHEGLGERPTLGICRILRRFSLNIAKSLDVETIEHALEITDSYTDAYIYGYMIQRSNQILEDQEQLRKALSTALERQRQELHVKNHAIHTYIHGIMLTDLSGNITYVNPAFLQMWGYNHLAEVIEAGTSHFFGTQTFDDFLNAIHETVGGQKELVGRGTDGSTFDLVISASFIQDEHNQPVGIMAFFIDVTERNQLETQLQRAQKMEALGTLAGGVAHDLNNILSGLVSYPELMLLDLPEDSNLRKPILAIQRSGLKMAAIVQDLLTLARRGMAVMDVLNLNEIILSYLLSPEYKKLKELFPNFHLKLELHPDLLNILGSEVHLSKTTMNLVANAAESMPDGGQILIATENRYIDKPIKGYDNVKVGDYVVLTVADKGVGISAKDIKLIFEPFYSKKVLGRSGTGLGMAVVWGTVKDHNGYIDVNSRESKGTVFSLYFPVSSKKLTPLKLPVSIDAYKGRGESILVVDDDEDQRDIAALLLKRLGYSVTVVSSGEDAVDYLKNHKADLLLLDMIMEPGIDGLETYKRILEFQSDQKAIIVSGYSETVRIKEAQKLGAGTYIKKPYLLEKIGLAVRVELDIQP
jgi:PAS domain S-box-containing protein